MLQDIETLIATRGRQCEIMAKAIRKYIANPERYVGGKNYTETDAMYYDREAAKCRNVLKILKSNAQPVKSRKLKTDIEASDIDICVFCNRSKK